jgi:hypothetical protein
MLTVSEHPETLDQIQETIQKWLGHFGEHQASFSFSRGSGPADLLCFISHDWSDLRLKTAQQWVLFEMKETRLKLNLDKFLFSTVVEGDKFCLNIELDPEPEDRFLSWALREIAATKHPAFQSRILRAFINLEENLSVATIEQATGAPTDFLVALEALS